MSESSQPANIRDLLNLRDELEMGDGLFQEVTGMEVAALFAFRRGKAKGRPQITSAALDRISRCREALALAKELAGGDEEKSLDWLYSESPTFGGRSPIDLTANQAAFEIVRGYVSKLLAAVQAAAVPVPPPPPKVPVPTPRPVPVASPPAPVPVAPPPPAPTKRPDTPPEEPPTAVPTGQHQKAPLGPPY